MSTVPEMFLAAKVRRDFGGWKREGCARMLRIARGTELRATVYDDLMLFDQKVGIAVDDGIQFDIYDVDLTEVSPGTMVLERTGVRVEVDVDAEGLSESAIRAMTAPKGSLAIPPVPDGPSPEHRWNEPDIRMLVRLVHYNDFSVLDRTRRFEPRDDLVLEFDRMYGHDTSADIVLRAEYGAGGQVRVTMLGVPMPVSDGMWLFFGHSSMFMPVDPALIALVGEGQRAGVEGTRRYLAEHPVPEEMLEGLSDDVPEIANGAGAFGDEREYEFPDDLQDDDLWWDTPLHLMEPVSEEIENETFVNRYFCYDDPDTLDAQSRSARPNFLFKPTGFEVVWYKHAFRSMWMNQPLSPREVMHIVILCRQALGDDYEDPSEGWFDDDASEEEDPDGTG